jgi:hypothetical protein
MVDLDVNSNRNVLVVLGRSLRNRIEYFRRHREFCMRIVRHTASAGPDLFVAEEGEPLPFVLARDTRSM